MCLWTELASTMVRINVLWSICGREASNQIQLSKTSVLIALIAVLMSNLKQCLRYLWTASVNCESRLHWGILHRLDILSLKVLHVYNNYIGIL